MPQDGANPSTNASTSTTNTTPKIDDDENPDINLNESRKKTFLPNLNTSRNPSTGLTVFASLSNLFWANLFTYGLTGNAKISAVASLATMYITAFSWMYTSRVDYELWKATRKYMEKEKDMSSASAALMPKSIFEWDRSEERRVGKECRN